MKEKTHPTHLISAFSRKGDFLGYFKIQNKEKFWTSWDYNEKISKTKILVTTKNGKVILESFDDRKAEQLITAISSSGIDITNIKYEYQDGRVPLIVQGRHSIFLAGKTAIAPECLNVWIKFIILPLTLTLQITTAIYSIGLEIINKIGNSEMESARILATKTER